MRGGACHISVAEQSFRIGDRRRPGSGGILLSCAEIKEVLAVMGNSFSPHRSVQPLRGSIGVEPNASDIHPVAGLLGLSDHASHHFGRSVASTKTNGREDQSYLKVRSALDQLESAVNGMLDREVGPRRIPLHLIRHAQRHYAMRRRRDGLMKDMFGEPAWDMMLELFISEAEGRPTPVKNLCLAACTSVSTALRRLDGLLDCGLVEKVGDDTDARRSLVMLTEHGLSVMMMLLQY
jgi:DNA-binding MarR family transcriptional regulator